MKLPITILLFSLTILFSCKESVEIPLKIGDIHDNSVFEEYILPQYRDDLMKELRYNNIYNISIEIDRITREAQSLLELKYYNDSGVDLEEIHFRLLMNNKNNTPMKIGSVNLDGSPVDFTCSDDNTTIIIGLDKKLIHGKTVNLTIQYSIDFSDSPDYYFGFSRIDESGFSIPHFYPVASRNIKGVWEDTPLAIGGDLLCADSSWFIVQIETDDEMTLVTSGKEISSEIKAGRQKMTYVAGPVRDFFISGDESFIPQVTISGNTSIISYSSFENSSSSMKAAQVTSSAISLFNSKFGVLPFKEVKIASLPMNALGIEFPGLFAIKEELYSEPEGYLFEPTVVHEAAHQWFYSLLGNNQLTEPWIDEGLTQYSVWLYFRERYGPSAALGLFNSFIERWDRVEREEIPINKPVQFYQGKEYGAIIYGRAPLFFLEVQNIMGEEEFHRFIRHLITRYSHRILDTKTFREEIIHFAGSSIDPLFEEYFDLEGIYQW